MSAQHSLDFGISDTPQRAQQLTLPAVPDRATVEILGSAYTEQFPAPMTSTGSLPPRRILSWRCRSLPGQAPRHWTCKGREWPVSAPAPLPNPPTFMASAIPTLGPFSFSRKTI